MCLIFVDCAVYLCTLRSVCHFENILYVRERSANRKGCPGPADMPRYEKKYALFDIWLSSTVDFHILFRLIRLNTTRAGEAKTEPKKVREEKNEPKKRTEKSGVKKRSENKDAKKRPEQTQQQNTEAKSLAGKYRSEKTDRDEKRF